MPTSTGTCRSSREALPDVHCRTAAVCRKCYSHPAVIEAFEKGNLPIGHGPRAVEKAVMRLLRKGAAATWKPGQEQTTGPFVAETRMEERLCPSWKARTENIRSRPSASRNSPGRDWPAG
jgi:hypothetical protein